MVSVIVSPLADRKDKWDLSIKKISSGYVDKEKMKFIEKINDQIEFLAKGNVKKVVEGFLDDNGIKYEKVEIFMDTNESKNISITKCKIYLDKSEIDLKEKVRGDVESRLKIKTEIEV